MIEVNPLTILFKIHARADRHGKAREAEELAYKAYIEETKARRPRGWEWIFGKGLPRSPMEKAEARASFIYHSTYSEIYREYNPLWIACMYACHNGIPTIRLDEKYITILDEKTPEELKTDSHKEPNSP